MIGRFIPEGAVMNILAAYVNVHINDTSDLKYFTKLTKSEIAKIETLGGYILKNFRSIIFLDDLSKNPGLSPKKNSDGHTGTSWDYNQWLYSEVKNGICIGIDEYNRG